MRISSVPAKKSSSPQEHLWLLKIWTNFIMQTSKEHSNVNVEKQRSTEDNIYKVTKLEGTITVVNKKKIEKQV